MPLHSSRRKPCIAKRYYLIWVAFGVALQGVYLRHFRAANLLFAASLAFCTVEMLL